jgi:hypothetical protein
VFTASSVFCAKVNEKDGVYVEFVGRMRQSSHYVRNCRTHKWPW